MDLALDRNPKLKVQYSQAQTLRDELKHQRMMLNRPLLSSSGTAIAARRAMRSTIIDIIHLIEKKFPDLDAFISKFESKRRSIDRLRHRTRSFKSVLSDEWIVVDKAGKRKKIVFLSEDHLLLHVAKGFGSISIPIELSQDYPEVAKRVGELESVCFCISSLPFFFHNAGMTYLRYFVTLH